jgi:hypothetical protein
MMRRVPGSSGVAGALLLALMAAPALAQPVAIVTELDGSVRILAGGRAAQADVAGPVERDATLIVERDARIVLAYPRSGSVWELRGPGRFVARGDGVEAHTGSGSAARRELAPVLRALQVRPEGSTIQGSAAMRGVSSLELQAVGPTGSRLAREPVRLCWRPLGAQWEYRVRLIDDDGAVLFEARTRDPAFELPRTLELRPGAPYLWHLLATGPNRQSAQAAGEFRLLDAGHEQALRQAESALGELDATGRVLVRVALRQQGFAPPGESDCPASAPR